MKSIDPSLLALHTHWVRADSIKERVRLDIADDGSQLPSELHDIGQQLSKVHALEVLYGLIYVVIEGFRELGCKDESVEKLLAEGDYVNLLRRFRNGVFHYQTEPMDKRLLDFITRENSGRWMRDTHKALGTFLERELSIKEGIQRYSQILSGDAEMSKDESILRRLVKRMFSTE
jgi:hypothetical protein